MELSNGWMIVIIIAAIITLIGLIYWIWSSYSSSQSIDSSLEMSNMTIGGYRKWKRAMRKLRK